MSESNSLFIIIYYNIDGHNHTMWVSVTLIAGKLVGYCQTLSYYIAMWSYEYFMVLADC